MGASVEAVVGTIITGQLRLSEIAFAVSNVFPPPTPTITFMPFSLAIWLSLAISFSEASPLNSSYL